MAEYVEKQLTADKLAKTKTATEYSSTQNIALPYTGSVNVDCYTYMTTLLPDLKSNSVINHFNFNIKDEEEKYVMPENFKLLDVTLSFCARSGDKGYEQPEYTTMIISQTEEDWTEDGYIKTAGKLIPCTKLKEVLIYTKSTPPSNYRYKSSYNEYNVSLNPEKFTQRSDLMLTFYKKEVINDVNSDFMYSPKIYIRNTAPVTLTVKYIKE